jgi:hypothetical protein
MPFAPGSRDDNWDVSAIDPRLVTNGADLQGCSWSWATKVSADWNPLVNQCEGAAGVILGVIDLVVA